MKKRSSPLNNKRKKNWFGNVLRRIDFCKKNKNLWIFGAWNGKYRDNSKYLFEFINKYCKDIESCYFVDNESDYKLIKKAGNNCVMIGTKEAKKIARKAGVSFYTNGMDDFGDKIYNYNSIKISLWHGVGFKKIYYADDNYNDNLIKKIYRRLFSCVARDYTITTSEYMKEKYIRAFDIKDSSTILTLGQPRNDIFFDENCKEDTSMIVYLPTYRKDDSLNTHIKNFVEFWSSSIR